MFIPNLTGQIASLDGYDLHAQPQWGALRDCPFSIVNLEIGAQKTSVRADSSASRGTASELVSLRTRILIPIHVGPKIGDRFRFEGESYEITGLHKRRGVFGRADHFECALEPRP